MTSDCVDPGVTTTGLGCKLIEFLGGNVTEFSRGNVVELVEGVGTFETMPDVICGDADC